MSPSLEEQANKILAKDAKESRRPLRSIGILDHQRLRRVKRKEIPMSSLRGRTSVEDMSA